LFGPCLSDVEQDVLEAILNDPDYVQCGEMPFTPSIKGGAALLNKLNKIFGTEEHLLGDLVKEFGGRLKTYEAIANSTVAEIEKQGLWDGIFKVGVKVGSATVTVTGRVMEGVVKIGNAWIPEP